jgi:hypothetical protein
MTAYRDPVRPINNELLGNLELVSTKVYPLPGATGRRQEAQADARLSGLKDLTAIGDVVTYYEHIATVRDKKTSAFFVAFRETMDAFLARQPDRAKYPEWLMKSPEKQAERKIHIYMVKGQPTAAMRSHEEWLSHIEDLGVFDVLSYFLHRQGVIDTAVYSTLR